MRTEERCCYLRCRRLLSDVELTYGPWSGKPLKVCPDCGHITYVNKEK